MTSIAVVRALALGDMICAIPALRALRARFPAAHLALIGLPWCEELVRRFPAYLDELIVFPGFPGIPEVDFDPRRTTAVLAQMQDRRFDLAVQLHGSGHFINDFLALLGAERLAGFVPAGVGPLREAEGDTWVPYPASGHEIDRLLALPAALGAPVDRGLEFPVTDRDRAAAARLLADAGVEERPVAVVHAGGSRPERRWPAARFAAVADTLAENGLRIVLTGTDGEAAATASVAAAMRARPVDLTGRTSLGALAGLVRMARLVVANDTGVSHLAAAIGTDSVTVFSASDRERWAPKASTRNVAVGQGVAEGATSRVDVPVADVVAAGRRLLTGRPPRSAT
jgi:ADP-heptose:LPS heptosyltransferase